MSVSYLRKFLSHLKAILVFCIALVITGCNSSSKSEHAENKATLADPDGVLASLDIASLDQLKKSVDEKGTLNFVMQTMLDKPELQAEDMIRLLHINNRNIEYHKLAQTAVPEETITKLKQLRIPPVAVEQLVELPKFQFVDRADISEQALAFYNQQQLTELNRHLALSGNQGLSLDEFETLQKAFDSLDLENNYGDLDQQFQNLIIRETNSSQSMSAANATSFSAKAASSQSLGLPTGYSVLNPANEKQVLTPESDLPFSGSSCFLSSQFSTFPRVISAAGQLIDDDFVSNENGDALMHFPLSGIAVIKIADISSASATLRVTKEDGSVLLDQSVENDFYLYLPVLSNESCDAFTFEGASGQYGLSLVDMITTERLSDHAFVEGGEYLSSQEAEIISDAARFNARSYSFASFDSVLTEFNFLFGLSSNSASSTAFDVVIYSPTGKVYHSANNQGGNGYTSLSGLESTTITREAGIWRIDILPAESTTVANQQLTGIKAKQGHHDAEDQTLTIQTLVSTDPTSKTKEFVLGTMKTLSFTSDGEKYNLDEGEISAILNTSMAPPIEIPSLLDEVLDDDSGQLNVDVALWQCWENSEKTGNEVAEGGECHRYRETYKSHESLFEYNNIPKSSITYVNPDDPTGQDTYTVELTEPCPADFLDQELEPGIGMCKKGIGQPYGTLNVDDTDEKIKVKFVLDDLSEKMHQNYYSEAFLYTLSNHYDLYTSWVARAVQVDTARFPTHRGLNVKTRDHFFCDLIDGQSDADCTIGVASFYDAPVVLETNRPIFGVPLARVNESTDPITFDYVAADEDEYDEEGELFAVLSFVASQSLNIVTGNFAGMVCDTVGLADDLHQLELNAEDDPVGSAKASINRFSSNDPFYGLHNNEELNFFMSGKPEENTDVDTYGQKIKYAQIACGIGSLATSGTAFAYNADFLLSLDYEALGSHADMVKMIGAMAATVNSAIMARDADAIATLIREGDFEGAKARLKTSTNVNDITQGTDIYSSPADLLGHYTDQGSAANGNNVIKSNVQYLVDGGDKTRAGMTFERVASVPVTDINVTFDKVKIISNYESESNADDAEVIMVPYVGEVNDADYERQPYEPHTVFQNKSFHGYGYHYNNVKDGDTLSPEANIYSFEQARNAAALYVELFIAEDDGNSIEDDDMIGLFSQTIKLEEIFNKGQFEWTYLGGNDYQLKITEYPVYNSDNQRVLENPLSKNYAQQKNHNRKRSPSALVSFTIDVTMSTEFANYPEVDTGLNPNPVNPGKDTYSMEMSMVNQLDISSLSNPEIYDAHKDRIILTDGITMGRKGILYSYDSSTAALSELFSYDLNDFSGDLLPIKEALTASKAIGRAHPSGERNEDNIRYKALPLFKLLADNRLLFVLSTDTGAKIMIVRYNTQGEMSLESSLDITDSLSNMVYSLGKSALSPDRTGLLIPYVPESYRGSDKLEPAHPSVLYYTLNDSSIRYQNEITNPDLTLASVEFIDDNTLAVQLGEFKYVSDSGDTWDQLGEFKQNLHNNCSSANLDCYFALYDRKIRVYSIDKTDPLSQDLDLSEEIHNPYTPYQAGYTSYREANQIRNFLFESRAFFNLETVSISDSTAVLRAYHSYFELTLDDRVNAYVHSGTFVLSSNNRLRHNAFGHYYCAEGLVCSGYMQDAMKPKRDDENSFTSDMRVNDFEFADTQRDMVAAIVAGENVGDDVRLVLLSLYDGAAYKGPQVASTVFDTEVIVNGADDKIRWPFEFTVTDRDTRIDQLQVSVTGLTTETTLPAHNSATSSPEYSASCTTDANGNGVCTGEILADFYNADLKQDITVSVSDGIFTSRRHFTIHVEREAPLLENISHTIRLKNAGEYNPISLTTGSINAANNCTTSSFCYLQQNGFVDRWVVTGSPDWLNCSALEGVKGNQLLRCTGLPPLGAEGIYPVQLMAINSQGRDTKTLTINVEAPDITPAAISFINQGDAELDTLLESNTVTISGITGYVSISISGGEYWRSSTATWSSASASNIVNGETIKLRATSSSEYSSEQSVSLTLAGVTNAFTITTKADPFVADTTPDAFSFTALTSQLANDLVESDSVTVTGINQAVAISVSSGEYKIGSGDWTSASGTIESGDTVQLRHTTSAAYSTLVASTLTIGGVSASFESTTQAIPVPALTAGAGITLPTMGNSFSFTPDNTGGEASSWSVSNKPDWASFNTSTGELSGTVTSSEDFTITITATNASGSDTFTSLVTVYAAQAPFINDVSCSIDDDTCDFSFTDAALWRASVSEVVLTESHGGPLIATLSSPEDYELSNGQLRLHFNASNNLPKSAGEWGNNEFEIKLTANNFNDVQARFYLSEGEASISAASVVPPIASGVTSTITLRATNRFDEPVRKFYPTITVDNDNSDAGALTEVYQYRQASEFGDSNIWKDFGNYNELSADENGDASFDFKTPGCIDLNDGFTLAINNYHLIYSNSDGDCVDAEWTIREEAYSDLDNNIVTDDQHNLYRVTVENINTSGSRNKLNLTKYDRNGQMLWTKALTPEGSNWFTGIEFVDGSLFIAGATNIDIDAEGEAVALGEFDLFAKRLDLEGEILWTRMIGTANSDYLNTFTISHDLIYLQGKINTASNMSGETVIYRLDLNGNNQQTMLDESVLTEAYGYNHAQIDATGHYYLIANSNYSSHKGVKKYNPAGEVVAANIDALASDITDMLLVDDALYITMNISESEIIEGETWNTDEASAVRLVRLRTSDLTVVWSHLIQSDATYANLSNSNGQLAYVNGVLYVSVVANQELYYQGLALDKTPYYSLNLLAFNADGAEDGTTGNANGQGEILSHQSWLTGPKHASDSREDPYLNLKEMLVSDSGWFYLSITGQQTFNSTAQMGRYQTSPYNYKTNSMVLKATLDATPLALLTPQTGLTRNSYFRVVTDYDNNLQWIDDMYSHDTFGVWSNANSDCAAVTWPGTGWRLPTPEEMERTGHIPVEGSVFEYYQDAANDAYFWSNEQTEDGWHVAMEFVNGFGDAFSDSEELYYRCVKDTP